MDDKIGHDVGSSAYRQVTYRSHKDPMFLTHISDGSNSSTSKHIGELIAREPHQDIRDVLSR